MNTSSERRILAAMGLDQSAPWHERVAYSLWKQLNRYAYRGVPLTGDEDQDKAMSRHQHLAENIAIRVHDVFIRMVRRRLP